MGAKPPDQVTLRRPTVKCEVCGRKFLNAQALKSHHNILHLKSDGKRPPIKKRVETRQIKKKLIPVNMLKRVTPQPVVKQVKTEVKEKTNLAGKKQIERKAKFECSVCAAVFAVYFSAFRHIQKNHCVDSNGEKVPPNSPLLAKPIRKEYCVTCDIEITSTDKHECPKPVVQPDHYKCLGCDQVFTGLVLFQHHVKGLHEDGAQSYFFPTKEEYASWKKDLEDQTELNFVRLNNKKSSEIFHCSHQANNATAYTQLCPSIITVRNYNTGVHVCYYKDHHGHVLKSADLDKYSTHTIPLNKLDSEDLKITDEEDKDLYSQFKKIMSYIVSDSPKVEVNTLKELLGKALEMTTVLNKFSEEKSLPLISKSLTDAQISVNLESLKSKRKHSPAPKEAKKETKKVKKDEEKNEKLLENGATKVKGSPALTKTVASIRGLKKRVAEIEKSDDVAPKSLLQSPTSFNESYKNFVDQNFKPLPDTSTPKPKSNVRKKEVVKTKIGQFKVKPSSLSPKESLPNESLPKDKEKDIPVTPIVWKPKADIKYEVKEQENDCNILILKI